MRPNLPMQRRSIGQSWMTSRECGPSSLIAEFVFTCDGEIQIIAVVFQKFRRFIEPLIWWMESIRAVLDLVYELQPFPSGAALNEIVRVSGQLTTTCLCIMS